MTKIKMDGVTEYAEEMSVCLDVTDGIYFYGGKDEDRKGRGRLVVKAYNEGGHNCTEVDLLQLIDWIKKNRPELINAN